MKQLTSNEWRLLLIFLSAVAACLCMLGAKFLHDAHLAMQTQLTDLREQTSINAAWLAEKPTWEAKAKWMTAHPPLDTPVETAASTLLTNLQASLSSTGLKIIEQGFSPVGQEGPYHTVTVQLKVSGPFGDLAKWLYAVQKPASYFAIKKISIKSDGEPPQVACDMEITEYLHGT